MLLFVVTSDKVSECFGMFSSEETAYAAIQTAYWATVKCVDHTNRKVEMSTGETLYLQCRMLDQ